MPLRSHATRARIGAINAHLTRGTYEQVQNVEVLNELEATTETTFGLERVATGGPRVRILLPPAKSLRTIGSPAETRRGELDRLSALQDRVDSECHEGWSNTFSKSEIAQGRVIVGTATKGPVVAALALRDREIGSPAQTSPF